MLACHLGGRRMSDTTRCLYYCLPYDPWSLPSRWKCLHYSRQRRNPTLQRRLRWLPLEGSLVFVAMNILGFLLKTKYGNRPFAFILDHFSKLTGAIWTNKKPAANVIEMLLDVQVEAYVMHEWICTDNGSCSPKRSWKPRASCLGCSYQWGPPTPNA